MEYCKCVFKTHGSKYLTGYIHRIGKTPQSFRYLATVRRCVKCKAELYKEIKNRRRK